MGRYITHEQLPFKGKLVKIRMRSYGFSNVASQLQNEEELLEITPDGIVKLSATRIDGREKCKVQIPVDDAAYIFNAFTTVFSEYKKEKIPGYSGFWKVRLLTDEDEVFFYHGSNGQDYMYEGKTLTEILRERTTLEELNGFAMRIDEKSHVSSIDISFRQTVAEDATEKVAEKNHQPMEDTTERLIISNRTHEIVYNRRVGNYKRVSLSFEMPEAVKNLLAGYEEQPLFEPGEVSPKPVAEEDISRTYQITVLYSDKKSASYSGSFDKEGLPDNWADFISRVAAFFDTESLGEMFNARTFDRVTAREDEVVFCGVEILGVVGVRYYRCDDDVCLGDIVVVPTPAKKQNLDGQVVEIRRCKVTAIPKELQKAKDVLYTIKDKDAENHG
jgi:hypothetical protein